MTDAEPEREVRLETMVEIVDCRAESEDTTPAEVSEEVGVPEQIVRDTLRVNVHAVNDRTDWEYDGPPADDGDDDPDGAAATVRWDE